MNLQKHPGKLALLLGLSVVLAVAVLLTPKLEQRLERAAGDEDEERAERHAQPDHPDDALKFRRLQLQDERGVIPLDGIEKARQHVRLMKQAQLRRIQAKNLNPNEINSAGIAPDAWTWLGPEDIGGRIRSILIHPTLPNNMWVGSVSGGIWRTSNGGADWAPVNDFMANLAVTSLIMHPANPNIMYAGTGEGFGNVDAVQGGGIFQSTDGGVTWNLLPRTNPADPVVCAVLDNTCAWAFINRLAISPNGATLLAATNRGVWRSTDAGQNWNQVTFVSAQDVDFHPTDSQQAIVGELGSARRSTDGGVNWTAVNFSPGISNGGTAATNGRVELAYARSNPTTIIASVNQNQGTIYRSTDGGQNFSFRLTLGHLGTQGWYNNALWVSPLNTFDVVAGGIHLWQSSTGGDSFLQISDGSDSAHADHHVIVSHPGYNGIGNRIVYFGNDGGLYRADDLILATTSSGWTNLNHLLGITQFYGAAANYNGVIIGGTQDNGIARRTGSWTIPFSGDGGFCAADYSNPNYFYGEYIYLQIARSADTGQTFNYIFNGIADAGDKTPNPQQANFIAPFVLDSTDPDIMLAGGRSLWRTNNVKVMFPATPTWTAIKAPTGGNSPISAIGTSPSTSSLVLVGHNNGDIYRTFNATTGAPSWTKIDTPGLPDRFVTRLVIDNTRATNWYYATFGGFAGDNIYRSTDNGATWTDVTGTGTTSLPSVPVRSLVYHPRNPNFLYAGTEIGIFTSEDAGATWEPAQNGPANVSVDELFWYRNGADLYPRDLIAVTHGRGLYSASFGLYVDCNYFGIERGTETQPYRTITAAINAVNRFQTIWLRPCTYVEALPPISKRLEMRSLGGSAIIRRP